jgi:hypothetical protein
LKSSKLVLITGASSGLGKELAKEFSSKSYNLFLIARNEERLNELANSLIKDHGIKVHVLSMDLALHDSAENLFNYCHTHGLNIDILVNNAGFGYWGKFIEQSPENLLEMLNLMVITTSKLTQLFARQMQSRGAGQIVQIVSTSAFQAGPYMASYFASKSYLLLLSEALQKEGMKYPKITIVCPGAFRSDFENQSNLSESKFFNIPGLPSSSEIAKVVTKGVLKNRKMIIPGFRNRLIIFLLRLFPRNTVHSVIAKLMAK